MLITPYRSLFFFLQCPLNSPYRTELAAHAAHLIHRQRNLTPPLPYPLRVEAEGYLAFPVQIFPALRHFLILFKRAWNTFGNISSMSRNPGGDNPFSDIVSVGKSYVFGGSHVTEEISSCRTCDSTAYCRSNMIIPHCNIGNQRPKHIKRCSLT